MQVSSIDGGPPSGGQLEDDASHPNSNQASRRQRQQDSSRTGSSARQANDGDRPPRRGRGGALNRGVGSGNGRGVGEGRRGNRRGGDAGESAARGGQRRSPRDGRHPRANSPSNSNSNSNSSSNAGPPQGGRANRRDRFGGGLTIDRPDGQPTSVPRHQPRTTGSPPRMSKPENDDLTSTLVYSLSTPPYPDCPICFASIHPAQPIWCCSPAPANATILDDDDDDRVVRKAQQAKDEQCCYAPFHLKCIRAWAAKSVKELEDAWRARGEQREGEWRCPACQMHRVRVPTDYRCFCGSSIDPKPPRLATPHSCGSSCSRARLCGHSCALRCHPGPCPPCTITTRHQCHCQKQTLSLRCARLQKASSEGLSCGGVCGQLLGCGQHRCERECHEGVCGRCEIVEDVRCYCGKSEKSVPCGEGEGKRCEVEGEDAWTGRFVCENTCDRTFECGEHACQKGCHPPSFKPPQCPASPPLVTHCPCGQHALAPFASDHFPAGAILNRTSCADPIPTCTSTCGRPLGGCDHTCLYKCHTGSCPPCLRSIVRPCRCGSTRRDIKCSELRPSPSSGEQAGPEKEILCDRPCGVLRACGRHQCMRLCCPLAALGQSAKPKGKKRAAGVPSEIGLEPGYERGGLHECDLTCNKPLSCGLHRCEARDHRGPCAPCLRSSFDELECHCGRTVLEPPVPCGTRIECSFPCVRERDECGHPKVGHSCHEDEKACPPCVFLVTKSCACGKREVGNVRCSQEKVSCGMPCGKLLGCGFHHCEKLCHNDDCGPCTSPCGKARKLCSPAYHHACTLPCHAPSACDESEPCRAVITLTCPCGRLKQPVPCARSQTNPGGREGGSNALLKCSTECELAKRNARLADALGINVGARERESEGVVYAEGLMAFARLNPKLLSLVEKAFSDFYKMEKKTQVLPHMPPDRRQFVRDLATIYRIDTQMVDQEPYRSVQLIRRIDTRIPTPVLSAALASSTVSLGKLTDLRASSGTASGSGPWRSGAGSTAQHSPVPSRPAVGAGRGWNVAAQGHASASSSSTAGGGGNLNLGSRVGSPGLGSGTGGGGRPTPSPRPAVVVKEDQGAPKALVGADDGGDVPDSWEDDA